MDFLTKKSLIEMQFYLNECKGSLGVCFSQDVPLDILSKSPIDDFYYYQKQKPNQWLNGKWIQGEICELPFLTDSIDVFIIWHNLDFYESPGKVIKDIWRALSPNGILLILGINNPCFFSKVNYDQPKDHLIKRSSLFRILLHQGFDVEIERTFGFHPRFAMPWLERWSDSLEVIGQFCAPMMGTHFLLKARKSVFGLNAPAIKLIRKVSVSPKEIAQPTR